jgi:hypothetical protein
MYDRITSALPAATCGEPATGIVSAARHGSVPARSRAHHITPKKHNLMTISILYRWDLQSQE